MGIEDYVCKTHGRSSGFYGHGKNDKLIKEKLMVKILKYINLIKFNYEFK